MRNVYPDRKVHFGSYPPLSGHDGCMRCHDFEHVDPEGRAISMDCTLCHAVLAMEESEPAILEELGLEVLR
jgi:hypothetical protein